MNLSKLMTANSWTAVYAPVTSVSYKAETTVKPVPYTSVEEKKSVCVSETLHVAVSNHSQTVTKYETNVVKKTVPVTTVIYSTKYETNVVAATAVTSYPVT